MLRLGGPLGSSTDFFLPYTCIQTLGTGQENKVHQDQGKVKEFHSKSGKIYVSQRG